VIRPAIDVDLGYAHRYGYRNPARRVVARDGAAARRHRLPVVLEPARRRDLVDRFALEYAVGSSIPQIASRHGLSYSLTRNLLIESGVQMRPRGKRTTARVGDAR
jgi:hypothetical protein